MKKSLKKSKKIIILSVVLFAFFCLNAFKSAYFSPAPTVSAEGENSFVNISASSLYDLQINGNYSTNEDFNIYTSPEQHNYTTITISNYYSTIIFENIRSGGEDDVIIQNDTYIEISSNNFNRFLLTNILDYYSGAAINNESNFIVLQKNVKYNFFNILYALGFNYENISHNGEIVIENDDLMIWYNDDIYYNEIPTPANIVIDDKIITPENVKRIDNKSIYFDVYDISEHAFLLDQNNLPYYFKLINNNFTGKNGGFTVDGDSIIYSGTTYNTMYLYNNKLCFSTVLVNSTGKSAAELDGYIITGFNGLRFYTDTDIELIYFEDGDELYETSTSFTDFYNNVFFENFSMCVEAQEINIVNQNKNWYEKYQNAIQKNASDNIWWGVGAVALFGVVGGAVVGLINTIKSINEAGGLGELWNEVTGSLVEKLGQLIVTTVKAIVEGIFVTVEKIIEGVAALPTVKKVGLTILMVLAIIGGGLLTYFLIKKKREN